MATVVSDADLLRIAQEVEALHALFDAAKTCVQGIPGALFDNLMALGDAVQTVEEVCEW